MDPAFETRLQHEGVVFTRRDATLLRAVDRTGSMNRAADELGRSYSRTHQRLDLLEDAFGPLIDRQRGGPSGGGSTLTDDAFDLLARFERLREGYTSIAETAESVLSGTVENRAGELGTVQTEAGRVRSLVPPDVDTVQVSVRADAVTLHDPTNSPPEDATSARNRLIGNVVEIDRGESISMVTVDVGAAKPLFALVTEDSRERLSLDTGTDIQASFKATATRATGREHHGSTEVDSD